MRTHLSMVMVITNQTIRSKTVAPPQLVYLSIKLNQANLPGKLPGGRLYQVRMQVHGT